MARKSVELAVSTKLNDILFEGAFSVEFQCNFALPKN
jgi:hypothetical protein